MTIKKVFLTVAAVAMSTIIAQAETKKVVAITAIIEHPSLNAVKDGAIEELARQGFKEGENLEVLFENAQGQQSIAVQIARQFVGKKPDVIIPIATPSAQAILSVTNSIPVVFSAVTDPVAAKLVQSLQADPKNKNVTGVSDMLPVESQIELIREVVPNVSKIGIIFNPGEPNSVVAVKEFKEAAGKVGIEIVEAPATKSSEVQSAARSLIGKADAMYTPTDNTVVATLESVVLVAQSAKIPFFSADTDSVTRGSIAAIGFSYHDLGVETGKSAARILKGEKPSAIPVVFSTKFELHLNKSSAEKTGITFPDAMLERAFKVIE